MDFVQCNLGSGVRLHLCETDKFNSVSCKILIQQDLSAEYAAATALIPLLLRRGSRRFPTTQQIARELEYLYAAEFGSDVLKVGERQILEFYFAMIAPSLLPNGERHLERGLRTFWDLAAHPAGGGGAFVDRYFSQEKRNLRQEVEGLVNNKRAYALARFLAHMCAQEPFGIYKYGEAASVEALQNEEVYSHYCNLWRSFPLHIFLVGTDLEILANLCAQFAQERQEVKKLKTPAAVTVAVPRFVEEAQDLQQTILIRGYRTNCTYLDADYYALLVGSGVLGGFPHSKLFLNVREKSGLAYYVNSDLEGTKGILTITAGIDGNKRAETIAIIQRQLEDLQRGLVSPRELEQTKRSLIGGIAAMQDNPSALINRNIIGIVNGELRSIAEVTEAIQRVTAADVVAAMNKIVLDTTYVLEAKGKEGNYGKD